MDTAKPPVESTDPEVEAALDSDVKVASGISYGSLFFGFVFVAGCATLFVKFNGLERIGKVLGVGKHRYRRVGDADLEQ